MGNIKLGPINFNINMLKYLFYWKKRFQNLGLGSLAIKKVCKIENKFKLKKLIAGVYENIPSKKVLKKINLN